MTAALVIIAILLFLLVLFLIAAIKVAREYERGIVFRLGRLLPQPKGPGLFLLIPIVDRMVKVDLRTITLNIPPQEVITKDNVPVRVNAVAYFRIVKPEDAIVQVENFMVATSQIAQTTLRSVLGQHQLDELLSEREKINAILQGTIDEQAAPWGIKVSTAPASGARPGPEQAVCPFCAGHEDLTPPETLRLGDGPTGWDVRVVPNLYPALERHAVVIHGPEHVESFGALRDTTIDDVAEAWQRRAHDAGGNRFSLLNERWGAGAPPPHSHAQPAWP